MDAQQFPEASKKVTLEVTNGGFHKYFEQMFCVVTWCSLKITFLLPPKYHALSKLYGITTQETIIFIIIDART
jgi:hypothetical protein